MIEQIKKDLRAQVEECFDLNHKGWHDQEGVLLSGVEALALLNELERLEVKWEYYKESRDALLEQIKEKEGVINEVKKALKP